MQINIKKISIDRTELDQIETNKQNKPDSNIVKSVGYRGNRWRFEGNLGTNLIRAELMVENDPPNQQGSTHFSGGARKNFKKETNENSD